jgi:DNA-binding response OmpR family regulator
MPEGTPSGGKMTRVKSGWCYIPFEVSRVVKILVVEPQDASRGNLCDELSRVGFVENVRVADCAQLAEDILRDFIPDIVIVDMQLPEQGAFRIADRAWPGSIPVIVCVTAFERRLVEARSRHRVEYLVRPFDEQDLYYVLAMNFSAPGGGGGDISWRMSS